jgi:membrane associated rhomboid family serine protease
MAGSRSIVGSSIVPFRMVFLMWLAFFVERLLMLNLSAFGIYPRSLQGLIGIVTAPLIHADYLHIVSNTIPILFLGATLFFYYPRIAGFVFIRCYFLTNFLVWLIARGDSSHIGASGVVYGLAFFLIFFGIFRRDILSLIISLIVILFYGTLFYGVLPTSDPRISFESHLFGALVGTWSAYSFRKSRVE